MKRKWAAFKISLRRTAMQLSWRRWAASLGCVVLVPKCLLCWIGYAALVSGSRLELCGDLSADRWSIAEPILFTATAMLLLAYTIQRRLCRRITH